jgi:hypothetical protein
VRNNAQLNSIIRNQNNPRTYQYGINAVELAGVPTGAVITGVSLRFSTLTSNPASWPATDITWNDYSIWAGPAQPTASWGTDPWQNFLGTPTQVRSGPMTLDAGTFGNLNPPGTTPNPWSEFYFDFQQPILYLGGDLAMLFSHPGSNDPNLAQYPEVVTSSAATYGVGRSQSVYPPGTTLAASTFYVMRVHYGYGMGCPGGSGTPPVLVQNANTAGGLGGAINLQIGNAPAAILFGFRIPPTPLGNGCDLMLSPVGSVFLFADAKGRAALQLTIPPAVQAMFAAQGAVLDPGAAGGYTTTNGVEPQAL